MKKYQIIIFGFCLIVIAFFGGRNYQFFKNNEINKKNYPIDTIENKEQTSNTQKLKTANDIIINSEIQNKKFENKKIENERVETINIENRKPVQSKNVIQFNSTFNDFENSTEIVKTNYEISYHTFDFDNKTITLKSKTKTGNWKTFVFQWTKITEPYDNGYIEFTIKNDKGVYQIWRSSMNNIGYEFYNKTKLVYYDVKQIK